MAARRTLTILGRTWYIFIACRMFIIDGPWVEDDHKIRGFSAARYNP